MWKTIVVGVLAMIVVGAAGVGIYDAWQNGGLISDAEAAAAEATPQDVYAAAPGVQVGDMAQFGPQGQNRAWTQDQNGHAGSGRWQEQNNQGRGHRNGKRGRGHQGGGDAAAAGRGHQGGGQSPHGRRAQMQEGTHTGQSQVPPADEWVTQTGVVVSVEQMAMTMTTDADQSLRVELGPPWFWSSQGVTFQPGDEVEVLGFEADEGYGPVFQAVTITRLSDGATLQLRDDRGVPLWSGH